ncbi:TIGR02453 family protein [Candidatus Marinarcus aquaticus]|uniref:TIGR02453 family protein n=1 Tax=Candidatus Marinarcus aquaticus TaxID=2044504 RepID=A0A4Q0XTS5_9BACT|nr:DUF2461 domain-containing protein [Candidatus Marinarcus aquaticus]RXJ60295.1 TIGR02453 family protein [Candidatus Marinarcus aquaticus]
MSFVGFNPQALAFLDEIKQNNNKVWFENNRHRWEELILKPNKAYVEEMGEHLIALAPFIKALPKVSGSLFRIYRDTRFSHDKTPIKTKIGILFWQGASHRMQSASFYMHYTSSEVFLATGIRTFKPPLLKKYRSYIQNEKHAKALHDILQKYEKAGIKINEPHYKRFPQGFNEEQPYAYLSKFNALYTQMSYKPNKTFFSEKAIDKHFEFYEASLELFEWLYELTLYNPKD